MSDTAADRVERSFKLLEAAAIAGKRCPKAYPNGPIDRQAIAILFKTGRIRSEVFGRNYRVVTILEGPHKGKSTAPEPNGRPPWLINGVRRKIG